MIEDEITLLDLSEDDIISMDDAEFLIQFKKLVKVGSSLIPIGDFNIDVLLMEGVQVSEFKQILIDGLSGNNKEEPLTNEEEIVIDTIAKNRGINVT